MRLIDADELKKNNRTAMGNVMVVEKDIDNEPTVKAIPIVLLRNWFKKQSIPYHDYVMYLLEKVITQWEKENGDSKD